MSDQQQPIDAPGFLSFVRLREVIDAKIERRLMLLAEVAALDKELAEAHAALGDIPSRKAVDRTIDEAPVVAAPLALVVVEPAKKDRKKYHKFIDKACARCMQIHHLKVKQKYCDPCFRAAAGERMAAAMRLRRGKRLEDEIDERIASSRVGYSN